MIPAISDYDFACEHFRDFIAAALPDCVNDPDNLIVGDCVTISDRDALVCGLLPFRVVDFDGNDWQFDFQRTREQRRPVGFVFRLAWKERR